MRSRLGFGSSLAMCAVVGLSCTDHHGDTGGSSDGGPGSANQPRKGELPPAGPACLVSQASTQIAVRDVDKVDLLFVVDNTSSMVEEQAALRAQFPRLISALATGEAGDGTTFPPARDLHLGVVSTDMGLVGISDIMNCSGLGQDGVLRHDPQLPNCKATYPPFLTYSAGLNTPMEVASDFACIASLGTEGCVFEQPLESALKALWPSTDSRVTFLGDAQGSGMLGHGDLENAGFLRNDPAAGLSVIAVVVVTDQEDCSSRDTRHWTPDSHLDPNNPMNFELLEQGLFVRCNFNPQNLYDTSRYVKAFQALRPDNEQLVVFGAIAGVPPETTSEQVLNDTDFEDPAARQVFYDQILSHPSMQPVLDDKGTPEHYDDTMKASCETANGSAYPPRRIVQVAREMGANAIVQSICQADLGPPVDAIVKLIGRQLGGACLPRPLVRNADGLVGCDVIWELPLPPEAAAGTPVRCEEPSWPFLRPVEAGDEERTPRGGARCRVVQLAVEGDAFAPTEDEGIPFSDGWYYDDFSKDVQQSCKQSSSQRIAFTPNAQPPAGVVVKLQCVSKQTADAVDDPEAQCSAGPKSAETRDVGDPCLPYELPENGFDPATAYVETNSKDCGGGVCMVYHLDGDPSPGCVPTEQKRCASAEHFQQRVFCTCRCDAPDGYAQCACPDGFECVTALARGSDDVRGGYCVRAGTTPR